MITNMPSSVEFLIGFAHLISGIIAWFVIKRIIKHPIKWLISTIMAAVGLWGAIEWWFFETPFKWLYLL
jgi:hypothetical protein